MGSRLPVQHTLGTGFSTFVLVFARFCSLFFTMESNRDSLCSACLDRMRQLTRPRDSGLPVAPRKKMSLCVANYFSFVCSPGAGMVARVPRSKAAVCLAPCWGALAFKTLRRLQISGRPSKEQANGRLLLGTHRSSLPLPIRRNRSIAFDLFFGLPYEKSGERSISGSIYRSICMVQAERRSGPSSRFPRSISPIRWRRTRKPQRSGRGQQFAGLQQRFQSRQNHRPAAVKFGVGAGAQLVVGHG